MKLIVLSCFPSLLPHPPVPPSRRKYWEYESRGFLRAGTCSACLSILSFAYESVFDRLYCIDAIFILFTVLAAGSPLTVGRLLLT